MNLDQMVRLAHERYEAEQRRRANAVHEASTEHVTARINELHHVAGITIAPAMIEDGRREKLEAELLEAVNRARVKTDDAHPDGRDTARRMSELMISHG